MTRHVPLVLTAVLCLTIVPGMSDDSKGRTVTIRDHIGVDWKDELVHYDLSFSPGAVKGSALVSVAPQKGKAIPCQVSDVQRHEADGSVRSCKVWFLATVPAHGETTYVITPGRKGPAGPGVSVKQADGFVELTTKAPGPIGIRLPLGARTFDWPAPASDVPGPIQALLLPSGRWCGEGRFEWPYAVRSYTAEITATGPVFAEARVRYEFETGYWTLTAKIIQGHPMVVITEALDNGQNEQEAFDVDRFYSFIINAGGFKPSQCFFGGRNDKPGQETLLKAGVKEAWMEWGRVRESWFASPVHGYELAFNEDRTDYHLIGWPAHTARIGCLVRFLEPGGDAVGFAALDTMAWRNPLALRFRVNTAGELAASLPLQVYKQEWATDGFRHGSPNYTGKTLFVPPTTARRKYGIMLTKAEDETQTKLESLFAMASKLGSNPLDEVKDWALDWPDPMGDTEWSAESTTTGTNALALMRDRVRFKQALGDFGRYSMAYHYGFAKGMLPGIQKVIDDPKALTTAERAELRRLCAWLAYDMNSHDTFPWGTGFHLNNPNMSIMAMEARIKTALLVRDHPNFVEWGRWTREFLKGYIRRFTRDSGALYENPHYSLGVTLDWSGQVNAILRESGLGDALDSSLFRKSMRFAIDWISPPDPRFNGHRVILPLGNCSYQSVPPSFANQYVAYYKERDPQLAGMLQWFANQTLPEAKKIDLAEEIVPDLRSVHYEGDGVSFRHGFGTPHETLFRMMAGDCDGHYEWESDQMTYTLYAKGQPINLHFGNGYFPMFCRPWLRNRVSIDHMYEASERNKTEVLATAFSPEADYLRAVRGIDRIRPLKTEYPVMDAQGARTAPEESGNWPTVPDWEDIPMTEWYRQVLFLKDADPKGPNYFVLRDDFGGTPTRPTDLSLWFLANSMTNVGDTLHFDGQCEVDMDVFVAQPESFEPETGSHRHIQQPYVRYTGFDPKYHPDGKLGEKQLFLRIKQPAGQGYMVVLYPRLKIDDPPAVFTRLGRGAVKVETPASTDYVFLSPFPMEYGDDFVTFKGISGAVRVKKNGPVVVIGGEGACRFTVEGKAIAGEGPFSLTIAGAEAAARVFPAGANVEVK